MYTCKLLFLGTPWQKFLLRHLPILIFVYL